MNAAMADVPAGHWIAQAPTRLIVSPAGHAYLFYSWGTTTEFQFGPGAPLRATTGEGAPGWEALLVMRGVGERRLAIAPPEGDALVVHIDGAPVRFRRAPPPLLDIYEDERLTYLGSYSAAERLREHARVSQLWLWRSDAALLAVGIFRYLVPGQRADFVTPAVMGPGQPEGDGWRFRWEDRGRPREAFLRLTEAGAEIDLPGWERSWGSHTLAPAAIFRDEVIELAPLSSLEAWEHWFDVQLVVHFSSAEIPAL
jgi:hypothetical protein